MAYDDIVLKGYVYDDAGTGVNGATVKIYQGDSADTATHGSAIGSGDTTDSNGEWTITSSNSATDANNRLDVEITSSGGTSKRRIKYRDSIQVENLDTEKIIIRASDTNAAVLNFFADGAADAGDWWRVQATDSDTFAIGSDKASEGTIIDYITITNGGDAASSLTAIGGSLVIGHTAKETISIDGSTDLSPGFQILGTAAADSSMMLAAFSTTATIAGSPILGFVKGGNATIGSHTVVTDNEELGNIVAYGDDGTDLEAIAAQIQFEVDGTPGTGDMPGRIVFATTADGAEVATEAMRIDSSQDVSLLTDSVVLGFGADKDTTLTHTDGTGLTLNSTNKLTFGDTGTFIHQSSDGVLTIESDTTVDINGAVDIDAGAIDGVTLGTNSAITNAVIDDVAINGKVITMTGDTSDTAVFTAGTDGTLSIVTTDAAAAAANIQITADGTAELAGTTVTLDSAADIELEATNDINIPADVGLTFGDDGEKIEGDGTNLVVESSGTLDMNSGGVLTLDSGAAINIEPASGSAVLIDGTISIDAESIFATDIKIGEDDETKIDFETADEIHFYAGNENQLTLTDGALTPSSNAIVDLGTDALEFKDAYFDGTLEADAITIGGTNIVTGSLITTLGTISAGTWQGTAIASAYLDADTAHLSTAQTFSGAKTFSAAATFDDDITLSADSKSIVIPKGHIQLENDPSAPSAPSAGYVRIYSDTTYDGIAIAHSAGTSFLNHQKLVLGAGLTGDAGILFNGDGTDTYIGFDGGTNDLMIGTGTTIGSNSFMTFSDTFGNIGIGHTPTSGNFGIQYEDDITGSNDQQTMGHVGIGIGGGHSMNTQNDAVEYSRAGTLDVNRPVLYINGSDTVADAFTLRVANEPQAGTRAWALWVDAGTSRFDGDIGNASYRIPKIWTTNQDTTNAENVSSWSQVKENINTYTEDALAILRKISVVSFSHVTDLDPSGRIKLGLLADSIDEPLAAPMGEYEFGYGIGPRIDMMGLAALAVRSIQELETRLLALEGGK